MKNKIDKKLSPILLVGLITVFVASLGDEIAAFVFAFTQVANGSSMESISLLMSCTLAGGLCASPIAMMLLHKLKTINILRLIFAIATLVLIICSNYEIKVLFCVSGFILGIVSGVFWSVSAVIIPTYFTQKTLVDINKIVHSIRNAGYILAPPLAGIFSAEIGTQGTLLIVAGIFIFAIPCASAFIRKFATEDNDNKESDDETGTYPAKRIIAIPKIMRFLNLPKMRMTLLPLTITICTTSTFNVAFMYFAVIHLHYSRSLYGIIISAISLGLVVGPLLLTSLAKKGGVGFGACCSAAVIGLCICLSGLYQSVVFLCITLFILGMANGTQNTLMATLVMQTVPKHERKKLMPTYMFILQLSVLIGFIIAGQVQVEFARQLLIISGAIACVFGIIGAINNRLASD